MQYAFLAFHFGREHTNYKSKGKESMTLLILAAGLGSRYGGLKQLDPVTENGEFIIDFSVYDAIKSGFDKIVFVIKEENLELFRETIGKRFEHQVKVEYAFQRLEDLPEGFSVPAGREKPWGTAQALLSARHCINEPFAVINADDFYGRHAYEKLATHLASADPAAKPAPYCMVGYVLENTLTENGTVSRGVCEVKDGLLVDVVERTKISKGKGVAVYTEEGKETELPMDTVVSMNCWGFTPDIFGRVMEGFAKFLANDDGNIKREYYLPFAVKEIMDAGDCSVSVYSSGDSWYGVTYREDHEHVVDSLKKLRNQGIYPQKLNERK